MSTSFAGYEVERKDSHMEDIAFVLSHVARNKARIRQLEEHDERCADFLSRLIKLYAEMDKEMDKMRKTIYVLAIGLIAEFAAIVFLLWMVLTL